MYIDTETGKNLLELQKSKSAKKRWPDRLAGKNARAPMVPMSPVPLEDIFNNKHPNYDRVKLVSRCLKEGILVECCEHCGYNTRREFDFKMPLKLWFRDNNPKNLAKENLRLLCFNCFYILAYPANPIQELSKTYIIRPGKQIS